MTENDQNQSEMSSKQLSNTFPIFLSQSFFQNHFFSIFTKFGTHRCTLGYLFNLFQSVFQSLSFVRRIVLRLANFFSLRFTFLATLSFSCGFSYSCPQTLGLCQRPLAREFPSFSGDDVILLLLLLLLPCSFGPHRYVEPKARESRPFPRQRWWRNPASLVSGALGSPAPASLLPNIMAFTHSFGS